jgi:hypothetical protein
MSGHAICPIIMSVSRRARTGVEEGGHPGAVPQQVGPFCVKGK